MTLLEKSLFGAIEKQNAAGAFLSGVLLINALNFSLLPRFIPNKEHAAVKSVLYKIGACQVVPDEGVPS